MTKDKTLHWGNKRPAWASSEPRDRSKVSTQQVENPKERPKQKLGLKKKKRKEKNLKQKILMINYIGNRLNVYVQP